MSSQKDAPGQEKDGPKESGAADRATSEFLLRACHDLRTLLRSIRPHAELLLKRPEAPPMSDLSEHLGFIIDGARRIDLLLDGLSSYSIALQVERESFQPTPMEVMLRTVLARLDKELSSHDAKVSYDRLPRVPGDPDRLIQVFENLLRNALQHRGEAPPTIHISAERHAEGWLFAVRDNGPGVEAAYLETIFRPFERLHGRQSPGPGLGLAVCREIVERHGGRMWAESPAGSGATFFFTLPED
jgi:signal transduction histidine kinase